MKKSMSKSWRLFTKATEKREKGGEMNISRKRLHKIENWKKKSSFICGAGQ